MPKGLIMNIQRYSLNDGSGIRTIVFLKGCPLRCAWCSNPESQKVYPEMVINEGKCIECKACMKTCKYGLFRLQEKDGIQCRNCGNCIANCPTKALEMIGLEMSVEEVLEEIEKDRVFYDNSSGGLTISGGEPLLQWEFARDLAAEAGERLINVTLETCGYGGWSELEAVAACCDSIMFDVKHMNPDLHKIYTGVSNDAILLNLKKLAAINPDKIDIRIPLITGVNCSKEIIGEAAQFAKNTGVREIHLLPYHRLGEGKYKKLGRTYDFEGSTPGEDAVAELKEMLEAEGFTVMVGG